MDGIEAFEGAGTRPDKAVAVAANTSLKPSPPAIHTDEMGSSDPLINPLSSVSGGCSVNGTDLVCTAVNGGFPSVGCRGFPVSRGKWYYECKVISAGCVQVGWVDCAYVGGADMGQGVGDDAHSWAYDGWRMYLWHEICADWGGKWDVGDVVGCAADLDARTLSFYLNGCGVEVDMGLAFVDIDFCGGLYPCVSFNRGESVRFNFGSPGSPFAFPPPPGYQPYAAHIAAVVGWTREVAGTVRDDRLRRLLAVSVPCDVDVTDADAPEWHNGFKTDGPSDRKGPPTGAAATKGSKRTRSALLDGLDEGTACFLEDAVEESQGEKDFTWSKRYFPRDDNYSPAARPGAESRQLRLPSANALPVSRLPKDRGGLLQQLKEVSRDLCVLYARMSVLRILVGYSRLADKQKKSGLLEILLGAVGAVDSRIRPDDGEERSVVSDTEGAIGRGDQSPALLDSLLLLIRLCSHTTSRTRIYLQICNSLPSVSSLPVSMGSVLSVGGGPFLDELRVPLSEVRSVVIPMTGCLSTHLRVLMQPLLFYSYNPFRVDDNFPSFF